MATKAVRTALHVTNEKEYNKKLKRSEKTLKDLSGGAKGVASAFAGISPQSAVAVAGVAAVAAAATGAAMATRRVVDAVVDLGQRGGEISPVAAAFEQMAGPGLLARMEESTGHLVAQHDLRVRTNQVLRTGIVNQEQWAEMVERTVRASQDLGRDVGRSVEQLATFASGGGLESLSQMGVNVLEVRTQLQRMGLTAETTQGRMVAMDLAIQQLNGDLGTIDNSAGNVGDSWQQITVAIQNTYDQVALAFADNRELTETFEALAGALRESTGDGEAWGTAIAEAVVDVTRAVVDMTAALAPAAVVLVEATAAAIGLYEALEAVATLGIAPLVRHVLGLPQPLSAARSGLNRAADALGEVSRVATRASNALDDVAGSLRDVAGELDRTAPTAQEAAGALRNRMSPAAQDVTRDVSALIERAGPAVDALRELAEGTRDAADATEAWHEQQRANTEALEEGRAAVQQSVSAARKAADDARERDREQSERQRSGQNAAREAAREAQELLAAQILAGQERKQFEIDSLREIEEVREETREALRTFWEEEDARHELEQQRRLDTMIAAKEASIELAEKEQDEKDERIALEEQLAEAQLTRITDTINATRKLANSTKGAMSQIISAMEATGASTEKTKKAYGVLMVAYNAVMAVTDFADMARSIAGNDYVAAAAYALAGAGHIAAAIQAGAELGGGSAKTPTPVGTFTAAESAEPADVDNSGSATIINNNYGFGDSNSEIGEAVTSHVSHYQRMDGAPYSPPAFGA